jgi:hypothetical protein
MSIKKLLIITILLVGLIAGIYLIYHFYFKQTQPEEPGAEINANTAENEKIFPLSKEKIVAPTINAPGNKIKYYAKSTGNIYEVNFDGSGLSQLSAANLANIIQIFWSPDKNQVLGIFQDGEKTKKYLHNYTSGKSTALNENIQQAAWSPDGKKIAVQTYDQNTTNTIISVANSDGSELKAIMQTRIKDLIVEWPTIDKISARTPSSGLSDGLVFIINPGDGTFTKILSGLFGLNVKWSQLGDKFIYSITSPEGKNPSLFSADQKGQNTKNLGVETIVEKCVFSQDNRIIICAVPQKISAAAVWPDDYYKGMVTVSDHFYKVNLSTGEKDLLYAPQDTAKSYDASELFLSPQEDYLFFINRKDGFLYGLKTQ